MTQQDRSFEHFAVGDYVCFTRTFTLDDFEAFARLSGDRSPLHHDAAYAARTRFGRPIVPLALATAPISAVAGMMLPGHRSLELETRVRAVRPVPYDVPIDYSAQVVARHEVGRVLVLRIIAFHQREVLIDARLQVQVRDEPPPGSWADANDPPIRNHRRDRLALVTGATGAIGQATCLLLAKRGWKFIAQARDRRRADELLQKCSRHGVEPQVLQGDLTCPADRRRMVAELAALPAVSDFVHAASPPIDGDHASLIEVNYVALREFAEALLPEMLRRQAAAVLLVGSSAVDHAPPGWEDYVAAKQAAMSYVRSFQRRWSPYGIRGVTLSPGWVLSDFSEAWRPRDAACLLPEEVAESVVDELERDVLDAAADPSPDANRPSVGNALCGIPRSAGNVLRGVPPMGETTPRVALGTPQRALPTEIARASGDVNGESPSSKIDLDSLVREFFNLPPDATLADAGLDRTPGWDSLGHLQLLLSLESALQLRFTAKELNQTTRLDDLRRLTDAKLRRI